MASQWVFGPFRLDPSNACLWCGVDAMPLPPKTFAVLRYLVAHPHRLVSKDELLEAVWPETAVSDAVVRVAIGALRRALGDTAQASQYIATMPRRGYRFVASVVEHPAAVLGPPGAPPLAMPEAPDPQAGVPHPPALLPPEAERRQLTVLFCDVVGSTALAGQVDPEDYREVMHAYHQLCAEVVQRFEGYVAQYLGDGVLGYFGYPVAHEDDAHRAVLAGLGLLDGFPALRTHPALPPGAPLAVRVGVHTGLAVVGAVGAGGHHEALALGETPNLASRLQHLAAPNTLVISAVTHQLVAGFFQCRALGAQTFPGLAQPLEVYRVLGASAARSRLEIAAHTGLTPLVGRVQEVGLLQACWTRATEGLGQVVLLGGEAGIGKSRLVQGLKAHIAREGHQWLECQGSPYYQHTALYPLTELLARRLRPEVPEAPVGQRVQHLEAFVRQYGLSPEAIVPLLAPLLSLPLPATYPPVHVSPEQQRQLTLHALLDLLLRQAATQPLLLVMEDLHWVDPSTLEWLSLLVDHGPTPHLLTLCTYRLDFRPPWLGRAHCTQVTLGRLSRREAIALTHQVAQGQALPAEVVTQIVAKTDGVPLFVEECTKTVLEAGLFLEQAGSSTHTGRLPPVAIPITLHDSLLARLDRLGAAKSLAQLGAVLGREFPYAVLQAVARWDEATVRQGLQQLVEAELLYQRGLPPQATYVFKHALIQDAAYQSLLTRTRQQYHQHIAQILIERFAAVAATQPEVVAQHYTAAGQHAQALPWWQRAGQQALERLAHREAVAFVEQGLASAAHLPTHPRTLEQAVDLRLALRSALYPSGDFARILVTLREAEALAVELDDPRRLGQVAILLSRQFSRLGAHDQAIAAAQRALALAPASGEALLPAHANYYLGLNYRDQGHYPQAIACFAQTVAALEGERRYERLGQTLLPAVSAHANLATCHAELGTFAEGRRLGEVGVQIAEGVDDPASRMIARWGLGLLALRQGDVHRALPLLEQTVGTCQEARFRIWFPLTAATLGAAYTLGGRVADAVPLLTQALHQQTAPESVMHQTFCSLSLGEAQMLTGYMEEAQALVMRTLAGARAHQEQDQQAYALRLLGAMAARREPPEHTQAEVYYRQALALAEELGMRPLQAHCHRGLGTLYAATGQRELARAEISTAITMYQAMDMTFWLPQTAAPWAQMEGER